MGEEVVREKEREKEVKEKQREEEVREKEREVEAARKKEEEEKEKIRLRKEQQKRNNFSSDLLLNLPLDNISHIMTFLKPAGVFTAIFLLAADIYCRTNTSDPA